jgi:hypothetical protein
MKKIILSIRERNPLYYDKSRDMETALAWNAIQKTLATAWREELFDYIQSVRLTEKSIIITTGKPVVNLELRNYREAIFARINEGFKNSGIRIRERMRMN